MVEIYNEREHYKSLATSVYKREGEKGLQMWLNTVRAPRSGKQVALPIADEIRRENA